MRDLVAVDSRAALALVDAHHRHAHRPRGVADRQRQVLVVRAQVLSRAHKLHDARDRLQHVGRAVAGLELREERAQVLARLQEDGCRVQPGAGGLFGGRAGVEVFLPVEYQGLFGWFINGLV